LSLSCKYEAKVFLLHVIERSSGDKGLETDKEQALQQLQAVIPENLPDGVTVIPAVRTGKAYQEILEHAAVIQTDLIVMGVRGRSVVDMALFGSTTHRVIQLGPCPVLVVRT
jgi:nucleotide-binding universal stress UspA family protein